MGFAQQVCLHFILLLLLFSRYYFQATCDVTDSLVQQQFVSLVTVSKVHCGMFCKTGSGQNIDTRCLHHHEAALVAPYKSQTRGPNISKYIGTI